MEGEAAMKRCYQRLRVRVRVRIGQRMKENKKKKTEISCKKKYCIRKKRLGVQN